MCAEAIYIPRKKLAGLVEDPERSAKAVHLKYVTDSEPGITRKKKGKGFAYYQDGKKLDDEQQLERINKLVLPPAWQAVWICASPEGHLQATGTDAAGRKQYRYHPMWIALRSQTKFSHMYDFGKTLPSIRKAVSKGLAKHGLPLEKVLAAVVAVMQYTNIRVGNSSYEKEYGSYGLTTLKDRHAKINTQRAVFKFKGKKGVQQEITLNNKRLARIVQQCKDIPGKDLFQYYDGDEHYAIDSGMVNDYIREISGANFTAKDFRTWFGSLRAMQELKEHGCCDTDKERKKKIVAAIDAVAGQLGNTRAVCRKYYIHPRILDVYNENKLDDFFGSEPTYDISDKGLSKDEKAMMKILEAKTKVPIMEI